MFTCYMWYTEACDLTSLSLSLVHIHSFYWAQLSQFRTTSTMQCYNSLCGEHPKTWTRSYGRLQYTQTQQDLRMHGCMQCGYRVAWNDTKDTKSFRTCSAGSAGQIRQLRLTQIITYPVDAPYTTVQHLSKYKQRGARADARSMLWCDDTVSVYYDCESATHL